MQALILAGGKGTRLRPLTVYTPKPIVPVVNRPFLLYQIDILKRAGIADITLSLSYQPDKIQQLLGNGSEHGVSIRYISEPMPMGTAGAYKFAMDGSKEPTIVFNGDILTDLEITKVVDLHKQNSAEATITLAAVEDPSRYGVVELDRDRRVRQFTEKPEAGAAAVNTINAGVYILEPSVLESLKAGVNCSFEYEIFPKLLEEKSAFFGYVMDTEYWRDIGTPANYLAAHQDLLAGKVSGVKIERKGNSDVATRAEIDGLSVLGEDCVIKAGTKIINSVIGRGVHIEERCVVENSVIWSHTRVSTAAEIRNSVIGRGCHVGRNSIVDGATLGDKTTLTDYTKT
jgi:mannose-1-phosphate guanylyltransferase